MKQNEKSYAGGPNRANTRIASTSAKIRQPNPHALRTSFWQHI